MKKFLCCLFIGCMCFALSGCGGNSYEDTNGADDYTLQTITDENIINMDVGSSGMSYSETKLGGITSTKYSSKNFNGVYEMDAVNYILPSDVSIYVGHLNVKSGNFKLAVVNDDTIIFEIPLDSFNDTYYFEDLKGHFAIRAAGESAAVDFHIELE